MQLSRGDLMDFVIESDGPEILSSNFWDSDRSDFFVSINDGSARLLIPDSKIDEIQKMTAAKLVIISRGRCLTQRGKEAIEIMFDDGSKTPYSIQLATDQTDDLIPSSMHGRDLTFSAWRKNAIKIFERPAQFRMVMRLPCILKNGEDQILQEKDNAKKAGRFLAMIEQMIHL